MSNEQNLLLNSIPSNEEIWEAVFGLKASSALGLDGFGGHFYRNCWDIISADVIQAIIFLFTTTSIRQGMNSNFVSLNPKVKNLVCVTDFCPIVMGCIRSSLKLWQLG